MWRDDFNTVFTQLLVNLATVVRMITFAWTDFER
jgi:hypothetical protein